MLGVCNCWYQQFDVILNTSHACSSAGKGLSEELLHNCPKKGFEQEYFCSEMKQSFPNYHGTCGSELFKNFGWNWMSVSWFSQCGVRLLELPGFCYSISAP